MIPFSDSKHSGFQKASSHASKVCSRDSDIRNPRRVISLRTAQWSVIAGIRNKIRFSIDIGWLDDVRVS